MAAGLKLTSSAERTTRTKVDTIEFSVDEAKGWALPPFQRPLQVNAKVLVIAEGIKEDGGVVPGILTFGMLGGKKYLVDGQHRREAFFRSRCGRTPRAGAGHRPGTSCRRACQT